MDKVIRFWSKVPIGAEGCWEWKAGLSPRGYGQFWDTGTNRGAHRYAYEQVIGPIPEGLFVCHRCDNPACVRPDHLFLGTQQDNMSDKQSKGRCGRPPTWGGADHCPRGHARTPENTVVRPNGYTACRVCKNELNRRRYNARAV